MLAGGVPPRALWQTWRAGASADNLCTGPVPHGASNRSVSCRHAVQQGCSVERRELRQHVAALVQDVLHQRRDARALQLLRARRVGSLPPPLEGMCPERHLPLSRHQPRVLTRAERKNPPKWQPSHDWRSCSSRSGDRAPPSNAFMAPLGSLLSPKVVEAIGAAWAVNTAMSGASRYITKDAPGDEDKGRFWLAVGAVGSAAMLL